jgi:hypothetical protein
MVRYFVLAWMLLAAAISTAIFADGLVPVILVVLSQLVLWYAFARWQPGR